MLKSIAKSSSKIISKTNKPISDFLKTGSPLYHSNVKVMSTHQAFFSNPEMKIKDSKDSIQMKLDKKYFSTEKEKSGLNKTNSELSVEDKTKNKVKLGIGHHILTKEEYDRLNIKPNPELTRALQKSLDEHEKRKSSGGDPF